MYEDFIRSRIEELRLEKKISERKMSLDLGHSTSYVHAIATGRALPSLGEFLYICEYFNITPKTFFDKEVEFSAIQREMLHGISCLDDQELELLLPMLQFLVKNHTNEDGG